MLLVAPVDQGEGGEAARLESTSLFFSFEDCSLDLQSRLFHPRLRKG